MPLNETIKAAIEIMELATEREQVRMLNLLKLEKVRKPGRKLDRIKSKVKKSDSEIAASVSRTRKGNNGK